MWSAGFHLNGRIGHSHNMIGHSVRFLLIGIIGPADFKSGLELARLIKALDCLIADYLLEGRLAVPGRSDRETGPPARCGRGFAFGRVRLCIR